jgi:hypothetical protein
MEAGKLPDHKGMRGKAEEVAAIIENTLARHRMPEHQLPNDLGCRSRRRGRR